MKQHTCGFGRYHLEVRRCATLGITIAIFLRSASPDPLVGNWVAALKKSTFVAGFPPLKHQSLECKAHGIGVKCVALRITAKGIRTQSEFIAQYDGREYPVVGSDEMTGVILKRAELRTIEGTFLKNHRAVFGYRVFPSADGRVLTITSVDPGTRRDLTSVVIYQRKSDTSQQY